LENNCGFKNLGFTRFVASILLMILLSVDIVQAYAGQDLMLVEAEDSYRRLVEGDSSYQNICFAERHLARTKLLYVVDLGLAESDVERLNVKAAMECDETPPIQKISGPFYLKTTAAEDQNQYIRLASEISSNDFDFILTLEQENGLWTLDRVHGPNRNGTTDHGFCGLNSAYHWNYIKSDAFKDPRNQLEYCYNIFKQKPGRFYGYRIRNKHRWKFKLIK